MKSLGNTIINEHFLVINIKTPSKTIMELEKVLADLKNYKEFHSGDFEKYNSWTNEHKNMIFETTQLKVINENVEEKVSSSWKLKENKLLSPIKKVYTSIVSPFYTYKSKKDMPKVLEEINTIENNFFEEHPEFDSFIDDFHKSQNIFLAEIKDRLVKIFHKNLPIQDYKGNRYNYLDRITDVEESILFIEDELIVYFQMIIEVLHIHIHDIMTPETINSYILHYLNDGMTEVIYESEKDIEKLRNKLSHNETLKLDSYQPEQNLEEYITNKNWATTIEIIKRKG